MRIPVPVAILILVLGVVGLWWIRTRKMDFMTPDGTTGPLPEFLTKPLGNDLDPNPVIAVPGPKLTDPVTTPKPPEEEVDFGDLESSPGLAEYSEHAPKGAGYLIRLASQLEAGGHFPRALLAWERVLDSSTPDDEQRTMAEDALVRIRPTLPRWNIDPEGDLPIYLQLGSSRPATNNLRDACREAAVFIRRDSDDALQVTPKITTTRVRDAPADAPIAVYFSGPGKDDANQSDVLSIAPGDEEAETYREALLATCYQLLRRRLEGMGGIRPPVPPAEGEPAETAFDRKVTRLHWKRFADSLLAPPPGDGEDEGE